MEAAAGGSQGVGRAEAAGGVSPEGGRAKNKKRATAAAETLVAASGPPAAAAAATSPDAAKRPKKPKAPQSASPAPKGLEPALPREAGGGSAHRAEVEPVAPEAGVSPAPHKSAKKKRARRP